MQQLSGKQKLYRTGAAVFALVCVCAALYLYSRAGGAAKAAVLTWVAAILAVAVPGAALAAWLAPQGGAVRTALGLTLGFLGFGLITVLASATRVHALCWLFPAGGVLLAAALLWKRRGDQQKPGLGAFCSDADWNVLLCLFGALVLLNAFASLHNAHPAAVGALAPQQDFYWNLGNVESFFYGFPPEDLRVSGVTITYHYLTELLQAGLCFLTGAPAFDVTAFYAYAPLAAAMLLGLYALGRHLWKEEKAGAHPRALLLAAMPLWLCGASLWKALSGASRFGNSLLSAVLTNLNGQATALIFLAAFLVLLGAFFKAISGPEKPDARHAAALLFAAAAAFYLLAFSKGPEAGLLACALVCALLLLALRRGARRGWLLAALALLAGGFAALYLGYFSAGAASSMHLSLTGTLNGGFFASILAALQIRFPAGWAVFVPLLMLAQSFLMAPLAFAAWAVSAVSDVRRLGTLSPLRLMCHACVVGGLFAYFIFDHYSSSQVYFAYIALIAEGILLLDSAPALWGQGKSKWVLLRRGGAAALGAVQLITMLCLLVYTVKSGLAVITGPAPDSNRVPLTAAEETGCAWLAENMAPTELFATNRMHTGAAEEGLSNVYTGLSGRHAYMESFKYAVSNMGSRAGDVMARYDEMNTIFSADTAPETVEALCRSNKIAYLVYCPAEAGSNTQLSGFETVYTSDTMTIYRVG